MDAMVIHTNMLVCIRTGEWGNGRYKGYDSDCR